jgi:hypothetical protein
MSKYQAGDIATFYFVIKEMDGNKIIQGWTDNRELAKFYMEFHKCKHFKLKSMTSSIEDIRKVTEENWNDEIKIYHIITRNRNRKNSKDDYVTTISVPATETECMFIRDEINTLLSSQINYSYINDALPYLKNKYQEALKSIFLTDMIKKAIYSQNTPIVQSIEFDHLLILYKSFPENFGG